MLQIRGKRSLVGNIGSRRLNAFPALIACRCCQFSGEFSLVGWLDNNHRSSDPAANLRKTHAVFRGVFKFATNFTSLQFLLYKMSLFLITLLFFALMQWSSQGRFMVTAAGRVSDVSGAVVTYVAELFFCAATGRAVTAVTTTPQPPPWEWWRGRLYALQPVTRSLPTFAVFDSATHHTLVHRNASR